MAPTTSTTSKSAYSTDPDDSYTPARYHEGPPRTSILARTVLMLSVSMSITEIETLMDVLRRAYGTLSDPERTVVAEFMDAIADAR